LHLHILYWAIKLKSCQGRPMIFFSKRKIFSYALDSFSIPVHHRNSCCVRIGPRSREIPPVKGINFHVSSPRIPLLLLPCRLSDSRAASWECRAHAILADPHRLSLRNPCPRASASWAFSLGARPHCDSGRELHSDEAVSHHGQAAWRNLQS
jgi:hypothetical protein